MRYPLSLVTDLSRYIIRKKLAGEQHFPLVMMLEPLHACNLTCTGCGRIREYESTIREVVPVEECIAAAEDCGAPIVSICGGEPLIYKDIGRLVAELIARKKHVSNVMPNKRLTFNIHLDGMKRSHDLAVERDGVFEAAIDAIQCAKQHGFRVTSNTTVYQETNMHEVEA